MAEHTQTPTRGVPLNIDGTKRLVRFSLKVQDDIREALGGKDIMKDGLTSDAIGTVLYYAMRASDPTLTLEAVKEMVDMQNISVASEAIIEASGMVPVDPKTVAVEAEEEQEGADPLPPKLEVLPSANIPAIVVGAPPSED